jgi:glycosyltransferase involved in cell wall biosynthesis
MAEKARDVDAFISVSEWFARKMQNKLNIPGEKLHIIPIGVNPDQYTFHRPILDHFTIGYLSRLNEENGFGVLVDAFILLKKGGKFPGLRLHATGGSTGDDKPFINQQLHKLTRENMQHDMAIFDDYRPGALQDFFRSLTVMSVPVLKGEAFGLYQVEALASGIPTVQPELGAFPEIARATGGGIIYRPNTPEALPGIDRNTV